MNPPPKAMSRRSTLIGIGTGVSLALAGCSGILDDNGDPESTVEEFYSAIEEWDVDTLNSLIHPDSGEGEIEEEDGDEMGDITFSLTSTEEIDEDEIVRDEIELSDDQAFVVADVEIELEMDGETETLEEVETWELREYDGDWLLYDAYQGDIREEAEGIGL